MFVRHSIALYCKLTVVVSKGYLFQEGFLDFFSPRGAHTEIDTLWGGLHFSRQGIGPPTTFCTGKTQQTPFPSSTSSSLPPQPLSLCSSSSSSTTLDPLPPLPPRRLRPPRVHSFVLPHPLLPPLLSPSFAVFSQWPLLPLSRTLTNEGGESRRRRRRWASIGRGREQHSREGKALAVA